MYKFRDEAIKITENKELFSNLLFCFDFLLQIVNGCFAGECKQLLSL